MRKAGYKVGNIEQLADSIVNQKNSKIYCLLYVRKGRGMYILDGRLTCLNEGDILFFPPGASFSFSAADLGDEYNESVDAVSLCFDEQWLSTLLQVFSRHGSTVLRLREKESVLSVVGPKWLKVSSLLGRLSGVSPHDEAMIILDILDMLSENSDMIPLCEIHANETTDVQSKVDRIRNYIDCHLTGRITLDDVAEYVGMNRTYFCLFFKKHMGMPLMDYINGIKIQTACRLLKTESLPISDISDRCGFKTVTYFNRVFKNAVGVSPSEYRKKMDVTQ